MRQYQRTTSPPTDHKAKVSWVAIRRLLTLALPHKLLLSGAAMLVLLGTAIQLSLPLIGRAVINAVVSSRNIGNLDHFILEIAGLVVLTGLFGYAQIVLAAVAGNRIVRDFRLQVFAHLQQLPVSFFDRIRSGDLVSHLSNDVTQLQITLTDDLVKFPANLLTLVGGVLIAFRLDWRLTCIVVTVLGFTMLYFVVSGRGLRGINRRSLDALSDAMGAMGEALSNIRLVKAFTREPFENDRAKAKLQKVYGLNITSSALEGTMVAVGTAGSMLMILGVVWYGCRSIIEGTLQIGDLVGFFMAIMIISGPMASLASLYTRLQRAVGAGERLFELLDEPAEPSDSAEAGPFPTGVGSVSLRGIGFAYVAGVPVLSDLSLDLPAGRVTAIVGPSGAGKTTLASLVYRFYEPQEGEIFIEGVTSRDIRRADLRANIGIVPQDSILFNGSIRDNIRYGRLEATDAEVERAARDANVDEFVTGFPDGYETIIGERGVTLSGGQRQRVAIARAVLKDPKILILDEATSALDTKSEALVKEALDRLMKGRTTLVIAHRLSTVQNADQIAVLAEGRVVELGSHDELIRRKGRYAELYELVGA